MVAFPHPSRGLTGLAPLILAATLTTALALLLLSMATVGQNTPPTAVISSPEDGSSWDTGEVVTFDGTQSIDDDQANLTYEWNFSGQLVAGRERAIVQRVFTSPGPVQVTLRVEDARGLDDTETITITILAVNSPPVAIITTPSDGQRFLTGRSITFDGRQSFDPDGGGLIYRWEADRFQDPIGTEAQFTIQLPLGRYRVTLRVFDQLGTPGEARVNITVEINVPPDLSDGRLEPTMGPDDLPGGFDFSVTYTDADNDPPEQIRVKVGPQGALVNHDLEPVDPGDDNFRNGARYHAALALSPGENIHVFTCSDLFYSCATTIFEGPVVYNIQTYSSPSLDTSVTVNWTQVGTVTTRAVPPPGTEPPDTLMVSLPVRLIIDPGVWSEARLRLGYSTAHLVDPDTITLMWFDPLRGLWVPASGQEHDRTEHRVEGQVPSSDVVMAVFGVLAPEHMNRPPSLVITYDIQEAYVNEVMWFDASCSTDPDGTVLLFYWDFVDDGELGPWVPGTRVPHVFYDTGDHQVCLMAMDGGNRHYLYENVSIRAERGYRPGLFDNPEVLYMLGSLLVIAFGLAVAYRLYRPSSYDDLFGKAYRKREEDEYSQLFRKLTEEELRGRSTGEAPEGTEEEGEGPPSVEQEDRGEGQGEDEGSD